MAFPIAPGYPAYSGNAIPVIYAMKRIANFYDGSVIAAIANTDYEKEIENKGDAVVIRGTPVTVVRRYVAGMSMARDTLQVPAQRLEIDQGQYFNFTLDDVSRAQMDADYSDDWMSDANEEMKLHIDGTILGGLSASVAGVNKGINAGRKHHQTCLLYTSPSPRD